MGLVAGYQSREGGVPSLGGRGAERAKPEDRLCAFRRPTGSGPPHPDGDDGLACGFGGSASDGQPRRVGRRVAQAVPPILDIGERGVKVFWNGIGLVLGFPALEVRLDGFDGVVACQQRVFPVANLILRVATCGTDGGSSR